MSIRTRLDIGVIRPDGFMGISGRRQFLPEIATWRTFNRKQGNDNACTAKLGAYTFEVAADKVNVSMHAITYIQSTYSAF